VGEAEGSNIGRANAGAFEAFAKRAGSNAGVDQQHARRRAEDRCVSGRAAGKDAEFE
jgi:hypothetical protein